MNHSGWLPRSSIWCSLVALLFGASEAVRADDANGLRFEYQPPFAVGDQRVERPAALKEHPRYRSYYLVDNADMFHLQVSLLNIGDRDVSLAGELSRNWLDSIVFNVLRDGEELSPRDFAVTAVDLRLRSADYLKDGKVLWDVRFVLEPGQAMAKLDPMPDEVREMRTPIADLPDSLAPYEGIELLVQLTDPDGGHLPPGVYEVQLSYRLPSDPAVPESLPTLSYFRQAIVVGPPTKTLDIVDSHVVRAAYAKYRGDTDGQLAELQAAVERVPDSIKAWRELASFYAEQELWEEAIACFQAWRSLAQAIEAGGGTYEELVDRGSVRSLTDYLDALTAQLAGPSLR